MTKKLSKEEECTVEYAKYLLQPDYVKEYIQEQTKKGEEKKKQEEEKANMKWYFNLPKEHKRKVWEAAHSYYFVEHKGLPEPDDLIAEWGEVLIEELQIDLEEEGE